MKKWKIRLKNCKLQKKKFNYNQKQILRHYLHLKVKLYLKKQVFKD